VKWAELELEPLTSMQSFSIALEIRGTGRLHFLPAGDITTVQLASGWPSPSFGGAFLPDQRSVTDSGFTATWRVLGLGRGYPSAFRRSEGLESVVMASSFGVDLIVPVGVHEASLRAAKYSVLFFGLTFLVYFLFETFAALRLHALQYLAVGMANCLFFLLLLAIAEHWGFGQAYVASAFASTLLIGGYSAAILRRARRALPVVALLTSVYGYLYVTLQAEDYALLLGALGLFAILAAFMWLTRRVDWFDVKFAARST
jgi:inner membrane protein